LAACSGPTLNGRSDAAQIFWRYPYGWPNGSV
jgi:hypothetical protein